MAPADMATGTAMARHLLRRPHPLGRIWYQSPPCLHRGIIMLCRVATIPAGKLWQQHPTTAL